MPLRQIAKIPALQTYPTIRKGHAGRITLQPINDATGQKAKKLRTWSSARMNARFQLRKIAPANTRTAPSEDAVREPRKRSRHRRSARNKAEDPAIRIVVLAAGKPIASL